MGKKPIIRHNTPEEEVHTETVRGSLVEDLATQADLNNLGNTLIARIDNLENSVIHKMGSLIVAMTILVILIKVT